MFSTISILRLKGKPPYFLYNLPFWVLLALLLPAGLTGTFQAQLVAGKSQSLERGRRLSRGALQIAVKMSYGGSSFASASLMGTNAGSRAPSRRVFEFGRTYVVRPKGRHQATIVWLHGLGDNGSSWSQLLEALPLPNIKWICPTASTRPIAAFGGFPCTAWSDVGNPSEDGPDDVEGLEASAAHIANLLSTEPADIKLGMAGFSMGAATALYSATCFAQGRYGNGIPFPINISAVVALSGWLPCSRTLKSKLEASREALRRAASLPILMCHGRGNITWISRVELFPFYKDKYVTVTIIHPKTMINPRMISSNQSNIVGQCGRDT
ncbi:hypothetical protein Taro_046230 [Colocasia esculenta]|uniref:Phospholipase/carboxylesterase/thioesterase domain-containing protein n=1 Tax=Colocasia esculenta TaxID=4460 RepID=A0A843WYS7_COLES|nr:hypothetical protein [Colocasia esculenta]